MVCCKVVYVADGKDAATVKEFADFLEAHGGEREAVTDAEHQQHRGRLRGRGSKRTSRTPSTTFDKFHVIKLAERGGRPSAARGGERKISRSGRRRYIFLKNVDRLTLEEKEALSRLEAQNLDTIQAMHIRMNLQQLFTISARSACRFLDRWNAWVEVCDLAPMKRLAEDDHGQVPRASSDRSPPACPTM